MSPDDRIESALDELEEHASTLRALADRLDASDTDAARTTRQVAHDLWELRKELGDER